MLYAGRVCKQQARVCKPGIERRNDRAIHRGFLLSVHWQPAGGLCALPVPFFRSCNPLAASRLQAGGKNATKKRSNAMCAKQQPPEGREIKGVSTIYRIVQELWERAEPRLSEKELEWFAGNDEHTEMFMGYIADTAEKIGSYILRDERQGIYSEKYDVFNLLFFLSESIRCTQALAMVRSNASGLIHYRHSAR
jgi:hypothetical protein